MKIGTRISPDWLERPEDLSFLTQIGVDCVDITMSLVPDYEESGGRLSRDGLSQCVDILGGAGLAIARLESMYLPKAPRMLGWNEWGEARPG